MTNFTSTCAKYESAERTMEKLRNKRSSRTEVGDTVLNAGTTVSQDGETAKGATGEEVEGAEEWHEDEQDIEGVKGVIAANAIGQPTTKRRNMRLTI
ncbi:hypothetical protein EB796_022704 [Bugula neritina]|uniref:Uncharacterized protein n=1 Tax=Bugula neritina TaxID=10212 RepID=A0A7J7IZI6_BUGNE|nr:hypothetical protein EB796_022704 [Bugula neritina]